MTIIHPIAATASDIVLALTDNDLSGFSVSPNWTFFPFMSLVSNIVGGLWALGIFVANGRVDHRRVLLGSCPRRSTTARCSSTAASCSCGSRWA